MTSSPLPDTWSNRDLPVLRQIVRMVDHDPIVGGPLGDIATETGLDVDDVYRAAKALEYDGLIRLTEYASPPQFHRADRVTGDARRLAGQWPTPETGLDRIIAALDAIAANTDDEDTRTKARKFADFLRTSAATVGLSVATAVITGQLPGQ